MYNSHLWNGCTTSTLNWCACAVKERNFQNEACHMTIVQYGRSRIGVQLVFEFSGRGFVRALRRWFTKESYPTVSLVSHEAVVCIKYDATHIQEVLEWWTPFQCLETVKVPCVRAAAAGKVEMVSLWWQWDVGEESVPCLCLWPELQGGKAVTSNDHQAREMSAHRERSYPSLYAING